MFNFSIAFIVAAFVTWAVRYRMFSRNQAGKQQIT